MNVKTVDYLDTVRLCCTCKFKFKAYFDNGQSAVLPIESRPKSILPKTMAKTINQHIQIFDNYAKARKFYDKQGSNTDLLKSGSDYFVENKQLNKESAIQCWPKLYTLILTK
jgi:hypothetical protein